MSVYVDPLRVWGGKGAPRCFQFKASCHMYADSRAELHNMALKIGLKLSWFQNTDSLEHYDLTEPKRKLAVRYGAIEVDFKHLVNFMKRNKDDHSHSLS